MFNLSFPNLKRWKKVGTSVVLAGAGAAVATFLELIPTLSLGIFAPIVGAAVAVIINLIRKAREQYKIG